MRSLTVELFSFIYSLTGSPKISYYISVFLISVLDICVAQGLILLLQEMLPVKPLLAFFTVPKVFIIGTAFFFINLKLSGIKLLEIADVIKTKYTKIIVYTITAFLLLLYSSLIGRLF